MKKLMVMLVAMMALTQINAQIWAGGSKPKKDDKKEEKDKKKKKDDMPFKDKLYYGGGVNLGFSGQNGYNVFQVGVSPMLGYKLMGPLSVGARLGIAYTNVSFNTGQKKLRENIFNFEPGFFARVKIYRGFYLHGELGNEFFETIIGYTADDLVTEKVQRTNTYVGLGYALMEERSWGSDISIMYNFAIDNDIKSFESPFGYRFAFMYNF